MLTPLNKYQTVLVRGEIKNNFWIKYLSTNIMDIDIFFTFINVEILFLG